MTSHTCSQSDTRAPIRVLWLIKGLGPGGAEHLVALSARLRDRSRVAARVAYLLPWKNALVDELEDCGVATICLGSSGSADPRWLWRLRKLLRAEPVDVVHAHSPLAAVGARLVVRTLRDRPQVVTTEHNVWASHTRATSLANTLTAALDDARFAVSGAVRDSMPPRIRSTTEVIRYGIDVDAVRSDRDARDRIRQSLAIAPHEIVVGTVANLRPTKAYPDLLETARLVLAEHADVRFVAVGQGPQEQEIRRIHSHLGLGDRFLLLGYRSDATRVMSGFDVFCLASRHEGLPIALMEAIALGLPVVTTDVGGIRELVVDGAEALIVPPAEPQELARALKAVVADADRRARMARAADARSDEFSVEQAVRRMESVYAEISRR